MIRAPRRKQLRVSAIICFTAAATMDETDKVDVLVGSQTTATVDETDKAGVVAVVARASVVEEVLCTFSSPRGDFSVSVLPPTLTNHKVATAMANQNLSARFGSVIFVFCQLKPPRLI